eukprot:superscaffoldBa00004289_g18609
MLHAEKLPRRVRELPLLEKVGLENEGWVVWEKERRISYPLRPGAQDGYPGFQQDWQCPPTASPIPTPPAL